MAAAKAAVRACLAADCHGKPVDVRIAPGVYSQTAALVFTSADSGSSPAARVAYLPDLGTGLVTAPPTAPASTGGASAARPSAAPVTFSGGYMIPEGRWKNASTSTATAASGWMVADLSDAPAAVLQSRHFYVNGTQASRTEVPGATGPGRPPIGDGEFERVWGGGLQLDHFVT